MSLKCFSSNLSWSLVLCEKMFMWDHISKTWLSSKENWPFLPQDVWLLPNCSQINAGLFLNALFLKIWLCFWTCGPSTVCYIHSSGEYHKVKALTLKLGGDINDNFSVKYLIWSHNWSCFPVDKNQECDLLTALPNLSHGQSEVQQRRTLNHEWSSFLLPRSWSNSLLYSRSTSKICQEKNWAFNMRALNFQNEVHFVLIWKAFRYPALNFRINFMAAANGGFNYLLVCWLFLWLNIWPNYPRDKKGHST